MASRKTIEKKITLGRDAEGKLIRRNVRGHTKAEVEKKAFEMRQKWLMKSGRPDNEMSFITYARHWYQTTKSMKSISTRKMYENVIEKHLAPALGDLYFDEISLSDLQGILNKNFDKYETCNKIRLTLRQLYEAAMDDDMFMKKAANVKKLVIPRKTKTERRAFTDEERKAILEADFTDRQRAFVWTLYYTGVRREEALALTASAFDFENKTVTISQTLILDGNKAIIVQSAKSSHSLRNILLPDKYIDAVRDYVKSKEGLIFDMPRTPGAPMTDTSFRRFWQTISAKLSVIAPTAAELTPHYFRHDYATRLYYSGITVKMAAKILGHADTTMIMKIYAHLDEQKENVLERLNKSL